MDNDEFRNRPQWTFFVGAFLATVSILAVVTTIQARNAAPEPIVVLANARIAISELQSYLVSVAMAQGTDAASVPQTLDVVFNHPDRYQVTVTQDGLSSGYILIGERWYDLDDSSLPDSMGSVTRGLVHSVKRETLAWSLSMLTNVERLPNQNLEGVTCLHYKADRDIEKHVADMRETLAGKQSEAELNRFEEYLRSMESSCEFWIGKDDYLARKMVNTTRMLENADPLSSVYTQTTTFSGFDKAPAVLEPLAQTVEG